MSYNFHRVLLEVITIHDPGELDFEERMLTDLLRSDNDVVDSVISRRLHVQQEDTLEQMAVLNKDTYKACVELGMEEDEELKAIAEQGYGEDPLRKYKEQADEALKRFMEARAKQ